MMSDVDDNNNDGTACHLIRINRCCDPKLDNPSPGHYKDLQPAEFTQEKGGVSLTTSSKANANFVSKSVSKPLNDLNVGFKCKSIVKKAIFELESSPDELEEISSSSEKENNANGESSAYDQAKSAPIRILRKQTSLRGILKYPPGWRRRAISESSALTYSYDTSFYGTSLDSPDILFEFEDDLCIDDGQDHQHKKTVHFPESKMATLFVFRPNSSILGRRLKNQKKAKKRKDKKLKDSLENFPSEQDESLSVGMLRDEMEATKHFISQQRMPFDCCDSVSICDVSSSSGCDCSTSECSGDEFNEAPTAEVLADYVQESKDNSNKSKRKNRRNRNRKNKQSVRTALETGGYDSD